MPATHYVTLTGPPPAEASPARAFPLLRWDADDAHRYAVAIRDDVANDLAEAVILALGFRRDTNSVEGGGWRLFTVQAPGLDGAGADEEGPLKPFNGHELLHGLPPGAPSGGADDEAVLHLPADELVLQM